MGQEPTELSVGPVPTPRQILGGPVSGGRVRRLVDLQPGSERRYRRLAMAYRRVGPLGLSQLIVGPSAKSQPTINFAYRDHPL